MTLSAFSVSASSPWAWSAPASTPGKFIISPRPTTPSQVMDSAISSGPTKEPVSSKPGTAGTQEGVVTMAFRGVRAASSIITFTPSSPSTLHTSWGSQ